MYRGLPGIPGGVPGIPGFMDQCCKLALLYQSQNITLIGALLQLLVVGGLLHNIQDGHVEVGVGERKGLRVRCGGCVTLPHEDKGGETQRRRKGRTHHVPRDETQN